MRHEVHVCYNVRAKAIKKALVVLLCRLEFLKLIIGSLRLPAFIKGFVTWKQQTRLACMKQKAQQKQTRPHSHELPEALESSGQTLLLRTWGEQ